MRVSYLIEFFSSEISGLSLLILHIFIEPFEHLCQHVEDGFSGPVAVAFMRQHDQPRRGTMSFQGMIEPLGLNGESTGVVVRFAVDEQDGFVDLVGVHERRDLEVDLRSLPESSPFALEAEGGQSPVVGTAPGDSGCQEVAVGEQVGCHEGAVAVAAHADALGIDDAHGIQLVDGRLEAGNDLVDKGVVHGLGIPDDRHLGTVEERITLGEEE